ncbi:MAG: cohesin domain-containing protein, partial [Limisphaerales bacterium]
LSRHVPIGQDVQFSVVAAGSPPLTYQWKWDGLPLVGKTSSTLTLNDVSTLHVGQYSVEVRNDFGFTNSIPALLTVFAPDTNAPVVVITSPIDGTTLTNRVTFAGTISGTITRAEWFRNRQLVGSLHLTNGGFSIPNILLATGTNTFMVRAYNEVGGVGTASVTVILETNRGIWIGSSASVQEGARVNLPIFISSSGEIGALSFTVLYDTNYLTAPELSFVNQESGAFTQVNLDSPGVIRATYVLPGRTLPAGHNTTFASVRFRTRSVPLSMTTPVQLELLGLYSDAGDPIASGTSVGSGEVPIVQRKYIGDNNANDRLDIADATVIIRMITLLDPIRSWDVTGNDLNTNSSLDAGDIVRVLRAVVNLDPQPSGQNGPLMAAASAPNAKISLSSSSARLTPGGQIKILVSLADLGQPLSGASFRLNYPAGALRLESSSAHSAGSLVPQNSLTMWHLLPDQDYAQQSGAIHFAASSAAAWAASTGAIAELNFTVLPGAASQYAWPLRVSQAEAAAGLDPVSLGTAEILLTGRDAQPAELAEVAFDLEADAIQLRLIGEAGVRYRVMSSTNLVDWTEVGVFSDASGAVLISDPIDPDAAQKFYRATQLD